MVKRIQLQPRDEDILEHVRRYRITTLDVLHRELFTGKGRDAVTSTLRRLRSANLLTTEELKPPRYRYYRLTKEAARSFGLSVGFGMPLGEQALPSRYAMLCYCCLGSERRQVLTADEFKEEFPDCDSATLPKEPYYLDTEGVVPRLAFVSVDLGADAGRIIRKCRKFVGERMKQAGFRELIKDDAFLITILTARKRKQSTILAAKRRAKNFPYPVRVEVVPELEGMT